MATKKKMGKGIDKMKTGGNGASVDERREGLRFPRTTSEKSAIEVEGREEGKLHSWSTKLFIFYFLRVKALRIYHS